MAEVGYTVAPLILWIPLRFPPPQFMEGSCLQLTPYQQGGENCSSKYGAVFVSHH